jgi:intein/homing endonuclease
MSNQNKIQPVTQRFVLNNDIKNKLKNMTPNFGYNGLGELVFRRTYSRNNEDWCDVVIRVVEGCMSIRKEHFHRSSLGWNDTNWQMFASNMAESLFKMEWMPPGRGLWMMGTDFTYIRGSMALNNCFSSDTKFWTMNGLKSFSEFKDGDNVIVRGKYKWMPAMVKYFGQNKLWKVTVQKNNTQNIIFCTPNHRWLARPKKGADFSIKTTSELQVNWKLETFAKQNDNNKMEIRGIQHGIVFGNRAKNMVANNYSLEFSNENKELSKYFFANGNGSRVNSLPTIWKELPLPESSNEYMLGFMAGWFASEGIMNDTFCIISNTDQTILSWAKNVLFKLDIMTSDIKLCKQFNTQDIRKPSCFELQIYKENISRDFFLLNKHNSQFRPVETNNHWRVVDVEPTERIENVWCVVEPECEEFTLANGILTKNCSAVDTIDDLVHSAEWTMDGLMNGVGVGFTTNWRGEASVPDKTDAMIFVIPDSREGWVESLIKLLCSYIYSNEYGKNKYPIFDYSQIRAHGKTIKGFGGTSSGFEPLKQMHERIESYLDAFCARRLHCTSKVWKEIKTDDHVSEWKEVEVEVDKPYSHTRLIADIFNAIGACVVAGNVRRCLPGDALVHTRVGLIPIKDVEIGQEVLTFNGYEKIKNKFEQGVQKLVKIITEDGDFRCTLDHKMAILNSVGQYTMTKTCDIKPGDRMISPRIAIEGKEDVQMPSIVNDTTDDTITIPTLDEDMSWLIGVYQGYGSIHGDSEVCIRVGEEKSENKIKQQFQRFSKDMNVSISKVEGKNYSDIIANSKQLCYFFKTYIKEGNAFISIPAFIWKTTVENRLSYITGLMDSNKYSQYGSVIVLSTVYESFAREVQNLLYSCGLESRLKSACYDKSYNELHLMSHHSKNIIDDVRFGTKSQHFNRFPMKWLSDMVPYSQRNYYSKKCSYVSTDTYERVFCQTLSYIPVEVIEIVEDVSEETYDIEVENRHEFFCNGYLSSNSAEICLGDVDDKDFINLKNYELNPERSSIGWLSNNSVVLRADDGYEDFSYIPDLARRIRDNGEPGMINLYNIQKYGRFGKELHDDATLVNPCFSANTLIAVADGRNCVSIKQLAEEGKDVPVYSINKETMELSIKWGRHPRVTGHNQKLLRIHFGKEHKGEFVDVTPNHKCFTNDGRIVEAKDLKKNDSLPMFKKYRKSDGYIDVFSKGKQISEHKMIKEFYEKYDECCQTNDVVAHHKDEKNPNHLEMIARESGLKSVRLSDTDVRIIRNCEHCQQEFYVTWCKRERAYCSTSCGNSKKQGQKITFEEKAKLQFHEQAMIYKELSEEKENVSKNNWKTSCKEKNISYRFNRKSENPYIAKGWKEFKEMVANYNHQISEIEELDGEHTVYNITVDDNHTVAVVTKFDDEKVEWNGAIFPNCGEIALESFELCNLAEVFPPRCTDANTFYKALEYATFYASTVSLLPTHRPETNAVIAKNRRIGVSISGIAQWASGAVPKDWGMMNYTKMSTFLRAGYKIVRKTNTLLAKAAGVPSSVRVTTVKPSGSISLLAGVTPGVHYPVSRYAIRRVRVGDTSPLVEVLKEAGVPHEKDKVSENTLVFEFVIDHGDVRPCEEVSPWEQFSLVQMMQKHYADNCVSATIYFDKDKDGPDVEKMLAMFIPNLKSVSMLPHAGHGYAQAPYEPITEEEYNNRKSKIGKPNFSNVKENVPQGSKFCSGDTCEL